MSGSAGLNGLRELEARIKSLPDQDRLKRQRDLFLNTKNQAKERLNNVRSVSSPGDNAPRHRGKPEAA